VGAVMGVVARLQQICGYATPSGTDREWRADGSHDDGSTIRMMWPMVASYVLGLAKAYMLTPAVIGSERYQVGGVSVNAGHFKSEHN
jgi:hypothetical protein